MSIDPQLPERPASPTDWRNKPSDRFILKWIKRYLSAPVTSALYRVGFLRPGAVTITAAALGVTAGVVFSFGYGWLAAAFAAGGQILDGVDGQLARRRGVVTKRGALLDSALDRYADGALVLGTGVYLARCHAPIPYWITVVAALTFAALAGSNLISYVSARAAELGLDVGPPTLASKGTRAAALILGAAATLAWPYTPIITLAYVAVHANAATVTRLRRAR